MPGMTHEAFAAKLTDVQNNEASSWLPASAESTKVLDELSTTVDPNNIPTLVVYDRSSGLTDEDFARGLPKQAGKAMGGLDILVNNAGKQVFQDGVEKITTEQFDRTLRTNLYATFWPCLEALELMRPGASIINVTSI